jgi:nucleoside-diphosphate-sugar epimerase
VSAANQLRRVLVTGCAGFLGSHLSELLLADGVEVVGVDCFTDYYSRDVKRANLQAAQAHSGFTFARRDISGDAIADLVDGVDTVFHLAAQAGVRGSFGDTFASYVRHNVLATQRLLEAVAAQSSPPRFVYASSSSIYGGAERFPTPETTPPQPLSPYGVTKLATEQLANAYHRSVGLATVGLRYFTAYGPRQRPDMAFMRFISAGLAGKPLVVLGDGRQLRDFTYVDDVVRGTVAAALRGVPGRVYNAGGGTPVVLMAAVELLGELLGRPLAVEFRRRAKGDPRATSADGSLAARELGFVPAIPLSEGLARQLEWVLELHPSRPARVA